MAISAGTIERQQPVGPRIADRLLQPPDTLASLPLRLEHPLECEALLAMIEAQIGKP